VFCLVSFLALRKEEQEEEGKEEEGLSLPSQRVEKRGSKRK